MAHRLFLPPLLGLFIWMGTAGVTHSQASPITVAISITDSTGQFVSAFSAAFRGLGDVEVVSLAEHPQYALGGVVLCSPDCRQPSQFSVALRLYSPATPVTARVWANIVAPVAGGSVQAVRDSVEDLLWGLLWRYERTHKQWVAIWGRGRYEQAMREFVRRIDYLCFDRVRALELVAAADDSLKATRFAEHMEFVQTREWIC